MTTMTSIDCQGVLKSKSFQTVQEQICFDTDDFINMDENVKLVYFVSYYFQNLPFLCLIYLLLYQVYKNPKTFADALNDGCSFSLLHHYNP